MASNPKRVASRRPLSVAEMRAKAVYRAIDKMMEDGFQEEEQMWTVSRVMAGDEFLAAAEERCLAGRCGNPLCQGAPQPEETKGKFQIDTAEQKVYAAFQGPGYCGEQCALKANAFAHRLGSGTQAMRRFERLLEQLREKKRSQAMQEQQRTENATVNGQASQDIKGTAPADKLATASAFNKVVSEEGKKGKAGGILKTTGLAAGTKKTPIMSAEVKERLPEETPTAPTVQSARAGAAVEGYVPKSSFRKEKEQLFKPPGSGRRVRFSEDGGQGERPIVEKEEDATVEAEQNAAAPAGVGEHPGDDSSSAPIEEAALSPSLEDIKTVDPASVQKAVFVFDVEEDAEQASESSGVASKFGQLRVVDAAALMDSTLLGEATTATNTTTATTPSASVPSQSEEDPSNPPVASVSPDEPREPTVDEILTQRLRQGTQKLFPKLAATLPPELLDQLATDSASEAASSDAETEDWMLSDEDSDDDLVEMDGKEAQRRLRSQLTFFTQLHMHLDVWVTDATLDLMHGGAQADNALAGLRPAAVPEIYDALSRFVSMALPPVLEKLRVGMPRGEVERGLGEALRTLHLTAALPAFTSAQWQLVVIVFLKALSMERLPSLRPAFETREGIQKLGAALAASAFTMEEFYGVMELLLEADA